MSARLGVVVSKRVIPLAAARNYCKRLVREAFRAERGALNGMDIVVRPRAAVTPAVAARVRVEIRDLLHGAQHQCLRREATRLRQDNS